MNASVNDEKKIGANESPEQKSRANCSSAALPCMDKLKEELSCAVRYSLMGPTVTSFVGFGQSRRQFGFL